MTSVINIQDRVLFVDRDRAVFPRLPRQIKEKKKKTLDEYSEGKLASILAMSMIYISLFLEPRL